MYHIKKVNQSRNRPGVAQRVPECLGSPDFHDIRHMKVVSSSALRTGHLYPQELLLVLIFTRDWVDTRVGRNMSLKNPVTPPGIDPGTVRLVAQRLNHYAIVGTTHLPCLRHILAHSEPLTGTLYIYIYTRASLWNIFGFVTMIIAQYQLKQCRDTLNVK